MATRKQTQSVSCLIRHNCLHQKFCCSLSCCVVVIGHKPGISEISLYKPHICRLVVSASPMNANPSLMHTWLIRARLSLSGFPSANARRNWTLILSSKSSLASHSSCREIHHAAYWMRQSPHHRSAHAPHLPVGFLKLLNSLSF